MTRATATTVKYGVPQVTDKVVSDINGVLSRIVGYEFSQHSESVPGNVCGFKSNTITRLSILDDSSGLPRPINFPQFVGFELVGQRVHYEHRNIEKTTYFDPNGIEYDRVFRVGKMEIEGVHRLIPEDEKLPTYAYKQTSTNFF